MYDEMDIIARGGGNFQWRKYYNQVLRMKQAGKPDNEIIDYVRADVAETRRVQKESSKKLPITRNSDGSFEYVSK